MKKVLLGISILVSCLVTANPAAADCGGEGAGQGEIDVSCESEQETTSQDTSTGSTSSSSVESLWLPACPGVSPEGHGELEPLGCDEAHTCPDPEMLRETLWQRPLTDADGTPIDDAPWTIVTTECHGPNDAERRPLTQGDVLNAIRRIGLTPSTIHTPAYTLVNLTTTLATTPHPITQTLHLIGYTVDLDIQPTTYTWHTDDPDHPQTTTTTQPHTTHTYTRHTPHQHPRQTSIDTTYTARYRTDNGPWTTINQPLTTTGPTQPLPVKQAASVLVQ